MKSKFISLIVSVAVIAGLMLVPAALPGVPAGVALAAGNVTIEVLPVNTTVLPGDNFSVEVWVQNPDNNGIFGVQSRLDFDSSYFNVTSIVNGPVMAEIADSTIDNVNGTADHAANMKIPPAGNNTTVSSLLVCTLNCKAHDAVQGTSTIDFVYQTAPPFRKTMVSIGAYDYLESGNMSLMHSGTVIVGTPKLTINITPWAYPGLAMGGCGIGYNIVWDMGVPVSYDFMVILPNATLPNVTSWGWNEIIIVAAADIIPGWGFINYTPVIGMILPGDHYIDYYGQNLTIYPMVVNMSYLALGTACNFGPLSPEIGVDPTSLYFETFEGIPVADQNLTVINVGGGTLNWSAADDAAWLSESPTSGSLTTSVTVGSENVTVSVNVTGLTAAGSPYSANITISGASNVTVPVTLKVKPATAVDSCRAIMGSGNSGNPEETTELYAGETIEVYVNFTAPPTSPNNGFNAIGITDLAPDGWTVTVNKSWCSVDGSPATALLVNAIGNKAEIMLAGPYNEGVNISVMYKVTVPTTADEGLNTWPKCGQPDEADAWLEYYFNEDGPYTNCIGCDYQVVVTQPGHLVGETREVNSAELPDVEVRLYRSGGSPSPLRSDISTPDYVNTAYVTGTYWMTANLTRWYELDITDGVMLPGADFDIDLTTPAKLAAGNTFDFEGDYGLIPKACTMTYALKSVNLWKIGCAANPEYNLSDWKVMDVCNSWLYPS